ncbi:Peptidoglycan/xylan/chitin deacetylase, PgdA/CDA1 family [Devosia sp. YR412]|uniref:polysaccharide deacetylase family protein n=1 Tax=Devosia sp. YR412 TaxID=1881030 RepID=UPI0008B78F8F|nr:polysaccharide deacetylase family protein [Devosia sp. YR412]SEQ40465.1 Peptidoglycan/xylan/chitin deacetylase, PgdA/CDA1 family [Devosia sp. YR412]
MRDFVGYADRPPTIRWPHNAGVAINFVLNYEEGSEYSIGNGDGRSETALIEVNAARVPAGSRDLASESMYEYGSRVGFWRIARLFQERQLPLTVFAAALALEHNGEVAKAIAQTDWDIVAHGYRWVEHYHLDEATEREHIAKAYTSIEQSVGRAPQGWYCRYSPSEHTRRLVVEHGGYGYDSDAYNDEVPYWTEVGGKPHLVVPYSLVTNDAKLLAGGGIENGQDYAQFLIDSFDVLRAEGQTTPRMMSIGLHPRVIGHPGRIAGLVKFLDHIANKPDVWVARRADIAAHWKSVMPSSLGERA